MISWLVAFGWLKAVFGFGLLVLVHEAGHLWALKSRGYPVHAFSIGFGKPWLKSRWGGTEYRVGWLPLGGYVLPEDPDEPLMTEATRPLLGEQPPLDQLFVAWAGPMANFLLAWFFFFLLIGLVGDPSPIPVVESTLRQGPSAVAGVVPGDRLVSFHGIDITSWNQFIRLVQENGSRPGSLVVERQGVRKALAVTPRGEGHRFIVGIVPVQAAAQPVAWGTALFASLNRTWFEICQVFWGLIGLLSASGGGEVAGPLAILGHISQAAGSWTSFLVLLAMLSINLGIFNLLPVPPLDGLRIALALVHLARRRPLEDRLVLPLFKWGTLGLALLFLAVTLKDLHGLFL